MKTILSLLLTIFVFSNCSSQDFKDGDIILHTSKSNQSVMLQKITKSNFTHCGIVFYRNGKPYVFEAVQPVKITPLNSWISRGVGGRYAVIRPYTPLSPNQKSKMYDYAKKQIGKNYDLKFQWSDNKIYCSELVWKCYMAAGIELSEPKKFKNYNLTSPIAMYAIKQRYGNKFNPNELVVSPKDIYNSKSLKIVHNNY